MTSDDCKRFLAGDAGRRIANSLDEPDKSNARNPRKWIRVERRIVGSKGDQTAWYRTFNGAAALARWAGGTARVFTLRNSEYVKVGLIELDGRIVHVETLSD